MAACNIRFNDLRFTLASLRFLKPFYIQSLWILLIFAAHCTVDSKSHVEQKLIVSAGSNIHKLLHYLLHFFSLCWPFLSSSCFCFGICSFRSEEQAKEVLLTCGQQSDTVQSSVSIAYEKIIATIIIIAMYGHGIHNQVAFITLIMLCMSSTWSTEQQIRRISPWSLS